MFSKPGLYLILLCLAISILSIQLDRPPAVVGASAPDTLFSAERAFEFVKAICRAPHSTGTAENRRVREYIADKCRRWGLTTEIQQTTAVNRRGNRFLTGPSTVYAANVYNVIARIKGKRDSRKSILIMAHYDSQPNAPGAGDDGAGVAAMLEVARILAASGRQLDNDVIFLFTDAEELGMLGAVGFVQDSVRVKEVGLVMNFDNRGSGGMGNMFEVNSNNGWAVRNYIRGAEYPYGNSLSYEIYKLLSNDTDFSIFRQTGVTGLNSGFIDGFVNYHSPNDKPEYLDLRSLQHHGSNMISLAKHFGNLSLEETKGDDVSFFNIAGFWMVSYPASWNSGLLILCFWLLSVYVVLSYRKKLLTVKEYFIGIAFFTGLLVVLLFLPILLAAGIAAVYPSYKHFYGNNSYNVTSYHIAFAALAVLVFAALYRWMLKKFTLHSLLGAILTVEVIALILFYLNMPTAIPVLLYPLVFSISGSIVLILDRVAERRVVIVKGVVLILSLVPAIWWLSPVIKQIFVTYGLSLEIGGVVLIAGLLLGMLLPVFHQAFTDTGRTVLIASLVVFIIALLVGHFRSGYSKEEPLQSYVSYQLKADEGKAYWITTLMDHWNSQFFPNPNKENFRILNGATLLPFPSPTVSVKKDSTANNVRYLHLHCVSLRDAISMRVEFGVDNPAIDVSVEGPAGSFGNLNRAKGRYVTVHYAGLDSLGFDMVIETKPELPFEVTLTDRSLGLPLDGYKDYPEDIVPGTGPNANTVQLSKKYVF